jgi:hypothetical protein
LIPPEELRRRYKELLEAQKQRQLWYIQQYQKIQQTTAVKGAGVLHWDGSFIARKVMTMDDTTVTFETPKGLSLSAVNTATVFFGRLSFAQALELRGKKPGVLLASGDFVEGNFKSLAEGTVVVDSVLFGRKSYQVGTEAVALWLREPNLVATNVLSQAWEKVDKTSTKEKAKLLGKVKPWPYYGYPYYHPYHTNLYYLHLLELHRQQELLKRKYMEEQQYGSGKPIGPNWRGGI